MIDDIKDEFRLYQSESNSTFLSNSNGLFISFCYLDEEDKDYLMQEVDMSLNQRIYLSLKNDNNNYLECTGLMCKIVVYILEKIDGDVSFNYQSDIAILERRSGILAVNKSSVEYYSEFVDLLTPPYIIKPLEIMELRDE